MVWNLGCILIELLLGKHKLKNLEIMDKFKNQEFSMEKIGISPKVASNFSPKIKKLLGKMCHYSPA